MQSFEIIIVNSVFFAHLYVEISFCIRNYIVNVFTRFTTCFADQMDRRESINASVYQDIAGILNAKTHSQLIAMQKQINQKIKSGDAVDIGNY